jgi:phenylpropionate dioxygenase-like ring-hydroxylating dioxygenase large terminal subunit
MQSNQPNGCRPKAADLAATRQPFESARTLPGAFYTSDEVFRLEQAELFGRMWLCIGREADIPKPGDFFTHEVGDERILVLRGSDATVRGFFNVCRHRGTRLVDEPRGEGLERLRCPYHAWTYALDGRLTHAPRMPADFARAEFSLVQARLGFFWGFIFMNLDERAEPLERYLADLPDLSRYRMAELRCGRRVEYEVEANWKFMCENYSECYHCPGVHPQLFRISDYLEPGARVLEGGACFNGGAMALRDGFATMSMSGRSQLPPIPGLSADDHRKVLYYLVYPNLLLSPHPDYVLTHTIWPLAPNRSRVVCEWLFTREAVAMEGFDPVDMVEFWDVTNRQDWGLCERAGAGASSRGYRPGPYQPSEDCVYTFDRWYADKLAPLL